MLQSSDKKKLTSRFVIITIARIVDLFFSSCIQSSQCILLLYHNNFTFECLTIGSAASGLGEDINSRLYFLSYFNSRYRMSVKMVTLLDDSALHNLRFDYYVCVHLLDLSFSILFDELLNLSFFSFILSIFLVPAESHKF